MLITLLDGIVGFFLGGLDTLNLVFERLYLRRINAVILVALVKA